MKERLFPMTGEASPEESATKSETVSPSTEGMAETRNADHRHTNGLIDSLLTRDVALLYVTRAMI